jgi:hypothetical protein
VVAVLAHMDRRLRVALEAAGPLAAGQEQQIRVAAVAPLQAITVLAVLADLELLSSDMRILTPLAQQPAPPPSQQVADIKFMCSTALAQSFGIHNHGKFRTT